MAKLEAWGTTDAGLVRQNNEDNWLVDDGLSVAIVADGMGGAACGEIASALTIEGVTSYLRDPLEVLAPELLIKEAIREANRRVLERAVRESNCDGMGSTVVVAHWSLPRLVIANVGDSRAYLWRGGQLIQLSYDQTLANELRTTLGLSEQEVQNYAHKNVLTMAVGSTADVLIRTRDETIAVGDVILLCSDGLYGPVGDERLAEVLSPGASLQETVERLVESAKTAGSEDNITAVLLRFVD